MRLGVCANSIDAAGLAGAGAQYMEENIQSFLAPERPLADFRQRLSCVPSGLPIEAANCFLPHDLPVVGPSCDLHRLSAWGREAIARAGAAGIGILVLGSGAARRCPEGWSQARAQQQFTDYLRLLAPDAQAAGLALAVEPLNRAECNLINTIEEGVAAVRAADRPAVGLVVDIFHMMRNGEAPEAILQAQGLIVHAHVAEREGRTAPGTKGDDLRPFLRQLHAAGYNRRISCECSWTDLRSELPAALAALRQQLMEAGYHA